MLGPMISTAETYYFGSCALFLSGADFAVSPAQAMNRFTTALIERFLSVAILTGQFAFGRSIGNIFSPKRSAWRSRTDRGKVVTNRPVATILARRWTEMVFIQILGISMPRLRNALVII